MRAHVLAHVLALALLLASPSSAFATAHRFPLPPRVPHAPGRVVIVTTPGALAVGADALARPHATALADALARFGLAAARTLDRSTPAAVRTHDVVLLTSDDPAFDPRAAAAVLRATPGVIAASPDVHMQLHRVPNDPALANQWHLGTSAAAIHARAGWDRDLGSAAMPIAIMDTGVDTGHEDLASKIWTNTGEIAGNGIDDDGNGYVDDVHGWDFGDDDADPRPTPIFEPMLGIDEGWHGTFVAGLAAAATDNATGIAGVAWNCPVMPLKVSDAAGDLALSAIASAFDYAIAEGAVAINLSLGTSDTSAAGVFQAMANDAWNADIVVAASAGNDGTDAPNWPASCDSVLAVASTNDSNQRSDWSNWGGYVDLCAPGEFMWSSIASNYTYDEDSQFWFELLWYWDTVTPYMENDGTSFASPLVAAAAAMVRSHGPWMHVNQIVNDLITSGDVKLYDNPIGPKLNLDRALQNVTAVEPGAAPVARLLLAASPNPAMGDATLRFTLPAAGRARLVVHDAAGRRVRVLLDGPRDSGPQSAAWDLRDDAGRAVAPGVYLATIDANGARVTRRVAVVR